MIRPLFRSLQVRLAARLAALFIAAFALAGGFLIYQAYDTAASLNDRELSQRADDLARAVIRDAAGAAQVVLPQKLAAGYAASRDDIFAVRDRSGRVLAASPLEFGGEVAKWPLANDDPDYFHLTSLGSTDYYGLSVEIDSAAGPVSVSVARAAGADFLIHSLLREFVSDIAWMGPLFMAATMAIGFLAIRGGLKPVEDISRKAAAISPDALSTRLATENLPTEVKPLVDAFNRALDRLERGFVLQKEFTANAAHELRTPLAIVTGALEAMEGNGELTALRADVARMNRLVEQLLRVARLDGVALEFERVDLKAVAASVVAAMAPRAIGQGRTIALIGPEAAVPINANAHAVSDAIRNVIENAVAHSPPGGEVVVTVSSDARVSVADRGSGIPLQDRERIFERFWRGRGEKAEGAGLGLAIVSEIMRGHGGKVTVADNPCGGTVFTLVFPASPQMRRGTRSDPITPTAAPRS
jgi:two-component system, OmpR family, sensor histidine kinase TctE